MLIIISAINIRIRSRSFSFHTCANSMSLLKPSHSKNTKHCHQKWRQNTGQNSLVDRVEEFVEVEHPARTITNRHEYRKMCSQDRPHNTHDGNEFACCLNGTPCTNTSASSCDEESISTSKTQLRIEHTDQEHELRTVAPCNTRSIGAVDRHDRVYR